MEKFVAVTDQNNAPNTKTIFLAKTAIDLCDSHLWFSVVKKPYKSRFTRVQRLSCCLSVLFTTMITNAMFYQVGPSSDGNSTTTVGPITFNLRQVVIGVQSSLMVFPVNLLLIGLFRSGGQNPSTISKCNRFVVLLVDIDAQRMKFCRNLE